MFLDDIKIPKRIRANQKRGIHTCIYKRILYVYRDHIRNQHDKKDDKLGTATKAKPDLLTSSFVVCSDVAR